MVKHVSNVVLAFGLLSRHVLLLRRRNDPTVIPIMLMMLMMLMMLEESESQRTTAITENSKIFGAAAHFLSGHD